MRTRIAQALIGFTLICAIGGHWAILQSVAWVGMIVSYSQDGKLTEAVAKTFDGQHPCQLCKVVQEGKRTEEQQSSLKVENKLDFWLSRCASLLNAPPPALVPPAAPEQAQARNETPPTPPPRLA